MENTREKNKRSDGRKKTYFDRENKKKAVRIEKTKSVAQEKGKQKKSSSSSKCPYQKKCGGCTYLNLSYEEQLAKKEQFLKKTLKGIVPVKGMVGMENPYHYRNKVNSAFARKKDGTIISGIYEKGTHKVVPVDECLLEDQRADAIIRDIRSLLKSFKIMIYNEDSGYGLLRHVMVRTGFASGEIMVVLVCVSPVFPSKNNFVKALRKFHPEITTIVLNVNDRTDSMVLGKRDIVLFGRGYIEDELCGCTFRISPQSFYQVNPVQTKKLYEKSHLPGRPHRKRTRPGRLLRNRNHRPHRIPRCQRSHQRRTEPGRRPRCRNKRQTKPNQKRLLLPERRRRLHGLHGRKRRKSRHRLHGPAKSRQ